MITYHRSIQNRRSTFSRLAFVASLFCLLIVGCNHILANVTDYGPTPPTLTSTTTDTLTPVPTIAIASTSTPATEAIQVTTATGFSPAPTITPDTYNLILWAEWELDLKQFVHTAAWSPDSKHIVFSYSQLYGSDNSTYMYTVDPLQRIWQVYDAASYITFSPDGKTLVSTDSSVRFWDASSGMVIDSPYEGNASLYHVFLPDDSTLVVGRSWIFDEDNTKTEIGIWDNVQKHLNIFLESEGALTALVVSLDGRQLATAMTLLPDPQNGRRVFVWDIVSKNKHCDFPGYSIAAFSPVENVLATTEENGGEITLFDTANCLPIQIFQEANYISSLSFSPDGQMIAFAGEPRGEIWILDTITGNILFQQKGLRDVIHQLAFSPDGRFLLALSYGQTSDLNDGNKQAVQIWKVINSFQ